MAATANRASPVSDGALATTRDERLAALDQMRGFVVGLVVLHHAVLAYCTFGHIDRLNYSLSTAPIVDPQRWIGFDLLVQTNDSFFMPLLFLLSGLFVWNGLSRRGAAAFLRARMRRLGLPFAVAVLTVVPLAYYPSFREAGGTASFSRFWVGTVTAGPWPSGPPWFVGILLLFDAVAALAFVFVSHGCPTPSAQHSPPRPITGFVLLLAVSCLLYLPLLLAVGPTRWFGIGPFAIQGSRVGLYAIYFATGVGLGRGGMPPVMRFAEGLALRWASWALLAALTGATFIAAETLAASGGLDPPARSSLALVGTMRAAFCAAMCFALPALFMRFGRHPRLGWGSLTANSFAIYLLHYPFVTWTQYGLLATRAAAPVKGAIAFAVALLASWASASILRRLPIVGRVL